MPKVRIVPTKIKVVKQTLEELVKDNEEYITYLRDMWGEEAVNIFVESLKKELAQVPPTGTEEAVDLVQVCSNDCTCQGCSKKENK
jgi:hypothetical protein